MSHLKLIFKTSEGTIDMTSFQSNNTVTQTK